ncbi:MAG: hypothetical protein CVU73_12100 [Deltaproteobacteria bacterium HGW-Deltaproteobacteria-8]|jgi:hypothetical protein|nr:MAG: hypothetical protein CVU73_12100 [Deltaproteobacteria bacterium HGW-Deltaproteobacteria-8]
MLVKAAPGLKVPREDKPRVYITDAKAVDVPESVYYRRCLAQGDLVPVVEAVGQSVEQSAKKAGAKPTTGGE